MTEKQRRESSELLSLESKMGGEFVDHPARMFLLKQEKSKGKSEDKLHTFRVSDSKVLAEAKNFLPQMAKAEAKLNEEMVYRDRVEFDVENVKEAEECVEMNVALVELNDSEADSETDSTCESTSSYSEDEGDQEDATEEIASNIGMHLNDSKYQARVKSHRKVELISQCDT